MQLVMNCNQGAVIGFFSWLIKVNKYCMISSTAPAPPLPLPPQAVIFTNKAGSLTYKFLPVYLASYRLLSGPDSITVNMLCLWLTGAKAPSLLPLRLSYHSAPELVSRHTAAVWSALCHLSRTIRANLKTCLRIRQARTHVRVRAARQWQTNKCACSRTSGRQPSPEIVWGSF